MHPLYGGAQSPTTATRLPYTAAFSPAWAPSRGTAPQRPFGVVLGPQRAICCAFSTDRGFHLTKRLERLQLRSVRRPQRAARSLLRLRCRHGSCCRMRLVGVQWGGLQMRSSPTTPPKSTSRTHATAGRIPTMITSTQRQPTERSSCALHECEPRPASRFGAKGSNSTLPPPQPIGYGRPAGCSKRQPAPAAGTRFPECSDTADR